MFGLDVRTLKILNDIFAKNKNIEKKVVFGSRAAGTYKRTSDIDIAIYGKLTRAEVNRLRGDLEESDCFYKVDLVHYEALADEEMRKNIDRDGVEF